MPSSAASSIALVRASLEGRGPEARESSSMHVASVAGAAPTPPSGAPGSPICGGYLERELVGDDLDSERPVLANDRGADAAADQLAGHQALQIRHAGDRLAADLQDQVLGPEAGARSRAAGDDVDHLERGLAANPGGKTGRQ